LRPKLRRSALPNKQWGSIRNIAPDPRKRRQWLTRQSCDRDYDTGKESTEAAENQNIVDFGHGLPRKAPARDEPGPKVDEKEI
jgi:hypothetical protein